MKWEIRSREDVAKYFKYLMKKGRKNWTKSDIKLWEAIWRLVQIDNFVKGKTQRGTHFGTRAKERIIEW